MLGATLDAQAYVKRLGEELARVDPAQLSALADALYDAYQRGRMVFICGNGGSGANASHFCEDLGKSSLDPSEFDDDEMPRLKVMSLTDNTPYILAWAN
ncbi:MAG: SIS domain-containing protein, partial [Pirellulales bacterium]